MMENSDTDSFMSAVAPPVPATAMGDPSGTPRKRVSQACVPCARRKTKCDGGLPICGQCRQRDVQECTYATSRRNKRSRRSTPTFSLQTPKSRFEDEYYSRSEGYDQQLQGFSALDALATSASARVVPPNSIQPRPSGALLVSRDASSRLFNVYFSTIHPMWPILYKPMYDLTGHENLMSTIPQPLLYAIYSIAACVQLHQEDRFMDTPPPSMLFENAIVALQKFEGGCPSLNLLKPSLETCQTLTILALQQHSAAESSSAALLCSLASSMAIELRIHRATNVNDPTEIQIRSRLWWNIFVLDKMIACEMGRPVLLRSEETDTPFPSSSESDEFQLLSLRSAGDNRVSSVKTHTISGFHTTIQIVMIMEKISREIYSVVGRAAIKNGDRGPEEIRMRVWQELKDYNTMMDSSPLRLDTNGAVAAPVTITNLVWMWCSAILLHRPFVSYWQKKGWPAGKTMQNYPHPLDVCITAANNICAILEGYADNLPMLSCDMIFPIFTCASTLSHYSKENDLHEAELSKRINMCIEWLLVLGKSWKNASTRQEMLTKDIKPERLTGGEAFRGASRSPLPGSATPLLPFANDAVDKEAQSHGDDWSFLSKFGDARDELFSMDADFRDLLQNHLDPNIQGQAA